MRVRVYFSAAREANSAIAAAIDLRAGLDYREALAGAGSLYRPWQMS